MRAETIKAEYDVESARRTARRRFVAETLPLVTALVAVGGLLATLFSQHTELKRQREERARADSVRHADAVAAEVRRFSESTAQGRIGALANFGRYWRDSADRSIIRALVLAHINVERDPTVRESIRELVLQDPDSATLTALAEQNRFIQARIGRLTRRPEAIGLMAWPSRISEADSMLHYASEDIVWNIKAIVAAVHHLRVVRGVDLSHVLLVRPVVDSISGNQIVWGGWDEGFVAFRSVTFKDVRLTGANLAGALLHSVRFIDVNLDSANLAGTRFTECEFRGRTTLAAFLTHLVVLEPESGRRRMGPFPAVWQNSTLDVAAFYPRYSRFERGALRIRASDPAEQATGSIRFYSLDGGSWRVRGSTTDRQYPKSLIPPSTSEASNEFEGLVERWGR